MVMTANLGAIGFNDKGTWNKDTAYKRNDLVRHDNALWRALVDHKAHTPRQGHPSWVLWVRGFDGRVPLKGDTTFYIRNNGDINNDGLSEGTAWPPTQASINKLATIYDGNNFSHTVDCTGTAFAESALQLTGFSGFAYLTFNNATFQTVRIMYGTPAIAINRSTLTTLDNEGGLYVRLSNINFVGGGDKAISHKSSRLLLTGQIAFSGDYKIGIFVDWSSVVTASNCEFVFKKPSLFDVFMQVARGSDVNLYSGKYTGSFTGMSFLVYQAANLTWQDTNLHPDKIPGTIAGVVHNFNSLSAEFNGIAYCEVAATTGVASNIMGNVLSTSRQSAGNYTVTLRSNSRYARIILGSPGFAEFSRNGAAYKIKTYGKDGVLADKNFSFHVI